MSHSQYDLSQASPGFITQDVLEYISQAAQEYLSQAAQETIGQDAQDQFAAAPAQLQIPNFVDHIPAHAFVLDFYDYPITIDPRLLPTAASRGALGRLNTNLLITEVPPSMEGTNSQIRRMRREAVEAALTLVMLETNPSAEAVTAAYQRGVATLIQRANQANLVGEVRRVDFEQEIRLRIANVVTVGGAGGSYSYNQLINLRMLEQSITNCVALYRQMWRREATRLGIEMFEVHLGPNNGRYSRFEWDLEEEEGAWGRDDGEGGCEGGNEAGLAQGEDVEMGDAEASSLHEEGGASDSSSSSSSEEEEDDDDADAFTMWGAYLGGHGVKRRWVCLLCPNHAGTEHKSSFVRHLQMSHGWTAARCLMPMP